VSDSRYVREERREGERYWSDDVQTEPKSKSSHETKTRPISIATLTCCCGGGGGGGDRGLERRLRVTGAPTSWAPRHLQAASRARRAPESGSRQYSCVRARVGGSSRRRSRTCTWSRADPRVCCTASTFGCSFVPVAPPHRRCYSSRLRRPQMMSAQPLVSQPQPTSTEQPQPSQPPSLLLHRTQPSQRT